MSRSASPEEPDTLTLPLTYQAGEIGAPSSRTTSGLLLATATGCWYGSLDFRSPNTKVSRPPTNNASNSTKPRISVGINHFQLRENQLFGKVGRGSGGAGM